MPGFIYCFSTFGDSCIYKAGRTDQPSLAARFKSYLGPSKPRVVVASRAVDDTGAAESIMLRLLRSLRVLRARPDLGTEWFSAATDDAEELRCTIRFVFDVVQKAVCETDVAAAPLATSLTAEAPFAADSARTLPSMRSYFEALDRFVEQASCDVLETGMERLLADFESSDSCPVFAEFLMWSKGARLCVARNRFPHL